MLKSIIISILMFSPLNAMDFDYLEDIMPIKQVHFEDILIFEHNSGGLYIVTPDHSYFLPPLADRYYDKSSHSCSRNPPISFSSPGGE